MQEGTVVSFTTVRHPPEGFGSGPLRIALIELEDGSKVMGQLSLSEGSDVQIGQRVHPRMKLMRINTQGLRIYDVSYDVLVEKPVEVEQEVLQGFPGYIVALYGPSGVGKSTVCTLMSSVLSEHVENVPILTTRKKKKGDKKDEYHHITTTEFTRLHKAKKIIAATQIPSKSEKRWYGYREEDIQAIWSKGKVPLVITEQHLLENLSTYYGRRSILSFGLLPPGKSRRAMLSQLLHRLRARGRDTEQHIKERLRNAVKDLDFFEKRKELFDHILVNEDLDTVIETVKGHVLSAERT